MNKIHPIFWVLLTTVLLIIIIFKTHNIQKIYENQQLIYANKLIKAKEYMVLKKKWSDKIKYQNFVNNINKIQGVEVYKNNHTIDITLITDDRNSLNKSCKLLLNYPIIIKSFEIKKDDKNSIKLKAKVYNP